MEREIDKDGFYLCPKCNGKGKMIYRAYDVPDIVGALYLLKAPKKIKSKFEPYISIGLGSYIVHRVILLCPICEGKGKIDWIVDIRIDGNNIKKFNGYFGCFSPIWSWCEKNSLALGRQFKTHQVGRNLFIDGILMKKIYYDNHFITQDLILKSKKRFIGPIILNEKFFSLSGAKLKNIYDKIKNHREIFKNNDYDQRAIKKFLIKEKLSEYLPPIFAVRDPEDFLVK
jgi:hypothetical protein